MKRRFIYETNTPFVVSDRYTVSAVDRSIEVLECLSRARTAKSLSDLAQETGIPKTTLFRILSTLEDRQCVVRDEEQKTYRLGVKLWELGNAFLEQSDLQDSAADYMHELAEACGESVFLGVLEEGEVLYVRRVESPKSAVVVRKLGQRAPVHCTATGLALLAFQPSGVIDTFFEEHELTSVNRNTTTSASVLRRKIDQIQKTGVAVVDGEYNSSLLCVASPILDDSGRPIAALTAALLSTEATEEKVESVSEQVRAAARALSQEQGYLGKEARANQLPSSD